jgi:UDP-glucuronate 4-epimerase
MAMLIFADKIIHDKPIDVFNFGKMKRDFTYIDDIVDGIIRSLNSELQNEVFNLGSDHPVELEYIISLLETHL